MTIVWLMAGAALAIGGVLVFLNYQARKGGPTLWR